MTFLSKGVCVPQEHGHSGIAPVTPGPAGRPFDWTRVTAGSFVVHAKKHRPRAAEVAIPYRGYWFNITSDDVKSRAALAILEIVFGLQESDGENVGPLLTLPVGGSAAGPAEDESRRRHGSLDGPHASRSPILCILSTSRAVQNMVALVQTMRDLAAAGMFKARPGVPAGCGASPPGRLDPVPSRESPGRWPLTRPRPGGHSRAGRPGHWGRGRRTGRRSCGTALPAPPAAGRQPARADYRPGVSDPVHRPAPEVLILDHCWTVQSLKLGNEPAWSGGGRTRPLK